MRNLVSSRVMPVDTLEGHNITSLITSFHALAVLCVTEAAMGTHIRDSMMMQERYKQHRQTLTAQQTCPTLCELDSVHTHTHTHS